MGHRFEGQNLEDALQAASAALGVERFQLDYHVVLEKRGFLGGTKRVVIEAEAVAAGDDDRGNRAVPPDSQVAAERPSRGHGDSRGRDDSRRAKGGSRDRDRSGQRPFRQHRDRDAVEVAATEPAEIGPIPDQGAESEEAATARAWVEQLIEKMKFRLVARSEEGEDRLLIRLYGADQGELYARDGELLDALQSLVNKALTDRKISRPVELDSAGFKERRSESLAQRAHAAAREVKASGRERLMPAMTPIERRIVHLTLQDDPEVTTESRGDGFLKRVAIVLRQTAVAPEP